VESGIRKEIGDCMNNYTHWSELPLYVAIYEGDEKAIEEQLAKGVDPNILIDCDNGVQSPLHLALILTTENTENIVKLLIKKGANINILNSDEETPLDLAVNLNKIKVIKLLKEGIR